MPDGNTSIKVAATLEEAFASVDNAIGPVASAEDSMTGEWRKTPIVFEWLVLPDEKEKRYTNFGDGREGDASQLVTSVNADSALNQGHADWRLPTINELKGLVGTEQAPDAGWYWSSSPYVGYASSAWDVSFGNGSVSNDYRGASSHVRLVRASQ